MCPASSIVCGEFITVARATVGSTTHHAWCRPAPGAAIQADRKRYLPGVSRRTLPVLSGTDWTEEAAVVIACAASESMRSIARKLGRSESSVRSRRTKLRLEGRLD
jgi:hypothetical protein